MTHSLQDLRDLLAVTDGLRQRFEVAHPTSQRLQILIKDCVRLRQQLAQAEAHADESLTCSECGVDLDDAGDGYDGKCASCADKAEAEDEESRPDPAETAALEQAFIAVDEQRMANDPWHVGELPGDGDGCTIRDQNGLTVATAKSPESAALLVKDHNAGAGTDAD